MPLERHIARLNTLIDTFEAGDGELWRTLEHLSNTPHRMLVSSTPLVDVSVATSIAPETLIDTILVPGGVGLTTRRRDFTMKGQKWRFLKAFDQRNELSFDTVPNRFVAHFLRALLTELRHMLRAFHQLGAPADVHEDARWLRRKLAAALEKNEAIRDAEPLQFVPHDDLVLNHDPYYHRILLAFADLLGA